MISSSFGGATVFYIIMMAVGVGIGLRLHGKKAGRVNGALQVALTLLLLFTMGLKLGAQPAFLQELQTFGGLSLLGAILPLLGSVGVTALLAHFFLKEEKM